MDQASQFSPTQTWPISDLRTMKLLVAPRRVQILTLLIEADRTVKEVAEILGLPASRLYYHFNLLEQSGLIAVVETRKVGGTLEKRYRASARSYRVNPGLLETPAEGTLELSAQITDALEKCKYDMMLLANNPPVDGDVVKKPVSLIRSKLFLTEEQAGELNRQLEGLHQSAVEAPNGQPGYVLLTAIYPAPKIGE